MFGGIKDMAKLGALLKNGPALAAKFEEVRAQLAERSVTAEVGGGAVTVIADGRPRIRSVHIEPAILSALVDESAARGEADRELAESLIAEGVNLALAQVQAMMMEEMAAAAREMNLPLPKEMLEGLLQRPMGG